MDYKYIRDHLNLNRYHNQKSRQCYAIFRSIEEFINPDEVNIFYPKNLFIEDKKIEMYVFLKGKIVICKALEGNNIEQKILYLKDINDFTCECYFDDEEYNYYKLILSFVNNEVIIFDTSVDTNSSWRYKLEKQLKNIVKVLIDNDSNQKQ